MDFDLDLGGMGEPDLSDEPTGEVEAPDSGGLDFNLDMGGADIAEEPTGELSEPSLDFDLDTSAAGESASDESDSTMMMDLGEDLDMGTSSSDESAVDLGLDTGSAADMDMPSEGDEVGTKLDLAKAYIDMGDPEGARSILDEVLDEGNDQQKTEAQQLIQQIA